MFTRCALIVGLAVTIVGCAAPGGVATKEDRDDIETLIVMMEGGGACDLGSMMDKMDDEVLVRVLGPQILKKGIPKTTTPMQAEFYRLALESKMTPKGRDKEALINAQLNNNNPECHAALFSFNNSELRAMMASNIVQGMKNAEDIRADRVTYEQLVRFSQKYDENKLPLSIMRTLQGNPDYKLRILMTMEPLMRRIQNIFTRYDVSLDILK